MCYNFDVSCYSYILQHMPLNVTRVTLVTGKKTSKQVIVMETDAPFKSHSTRQMTNGRSVCFDKALFCKTVCCSWSKSALTS